MLNIVFFITEHFNFLCSNLQFEYWKWYQIMGSKQQLFMDTQSVPQSLSLWGWSGRPILGIGRARHTCLGHPLSSHFLLTIIDRKPGHKDSYTITCILWLMLAGLCPKFGCAVTLVGHSWNSMWMVACIHPTQVFPMRCFMCRRCGCGAGLVYISHVVITCHSLAQILAF